MNLIVYKTPKNTLKITINLRFYKVSFIMFKTKDLHIFFNVNKVFNPLSYSFT